MPSSPWLLWPHHIQRFWRKMKAKVLSPATTFLKMYRLREAQSFKDTSIVSVELSLKQCKSTQLLTTLSKGRSDTTSYQHYEPTDGECISVESVPGSKTYASFGDDGTTASVSAYGEIIQISKYLGLGDSGIFSVDPDELEEPFLVSSRAAELHDKAQALGSGFGLSMRRIESLSPPKMEFLQARWPRLTYNVPQVNITVQLLVHNGTVIQQYTIDNTRDEDLEMVFDTGVLLREQEFASLSHKFNMSGSLDDAYDKSHGPNGYGLLVVHKLDDSQIPTEYPADSHMAKQNETSIARTSDQAEQPVLKTSEGDQQLKDTAPASYEIGHHPEAICVVMGLFVDGVSTKLVSSPGNLHVQLVSKQSKTRLTAAYKAIAVLSKPVRWQALMIPATDVDIQRILTPYQHSTVRTLCPFPHDGKLNFMVQRNLEHILSVCSIPIKNEAGRDTVADSTTSTDEPSIALTCGDIAGHRVNISGSLYDLLIHLKRIGVNI